MAGLTTKLRDLATSLVFSLSERRRSSLAMVAAVLVSVVMIVVIEDDPAMSTGDAAVLALSAYLLTYLVLTAVAFSAATPAQIRKWASRESRGTFWQRYVYGTAPGPGVSLVFSGLALAVAVWWLPTSAHSVLSPPTRVAITFALVAVAWACVMISFAVAFHGDNLVEDGKGLDFPGDTSPGWSDYVYFSLAVMTTFGTTDVNVTSVQMRNTVSVNAAIAFVFNTVIVATLVSALSSV